MTEGRSAVEHPEFGRLRATVAKRLMEVSPGQFPSLVATTRVASLVAQEVIDRGFLADQSGRCPICRVSPCYCDTDVEADESGRRTDA